MNVQAAIALCVCVGGIVQGGNVLSNMGGGKVLGGGSSPGGSCPGGSCPGGKCPTADNALLPRDARRDSCPFANCDTDGKCDSALNSSLLHISMHEQNASSVNLNHIFV